MKRLTLRFLLCFSLAINAYAGSVTVQQIDQAGQAKKSNGQTTQSTSGSAASGQGTESLPDFVRLADGRIVPFGAGTICTDDCVQSEMASMMDDSGASRIATLGRLNPWLIAIPVIATGVVACAVLCGGDSSTVKAPVLESSTPGIVNPTPTPGSTVAPQADVPEPATLILVGFGLVAAARTRKTRRAAQGEK